MPLTKAFLNVRWSVFAARFFLNLVYEFDLDRDFEPDFLYDTLCGIYIQSK
jgi:TRAP-type mannitol/chloroaromatic compound transport system permease small subunit